MFIIISKGRLGNLATSKDMSKDPSSILFSKFCSGDSHEVLMGSWV